MLPQGQAKEITIWAKLHNVIIVDIINIVKIAARRHRMGTGKIEVTLTYYQDDIVMIFLFLEPNKLLWLSQMKNIAVHV